MSDYTLPVFILYKRILMKRIRYSEKEGGIEKKSRKMLEQGLKHLWGRQHFLSYSPSLKSCCSPGPAGGQQSQKWIS
jgi:hypothetical protein